MRKKVTVAVLASAVLGIGSMAVAKEKPARCPPEGIAIPTIRVVGTSCEVARKVIHADLQGKRYEQWSCRSFGGAGIRRVDCRNEKDKRQLVTFVVES